MTFDSIIIGAGISGLSVAHYLNKAGRKVLLLEASDRVGGVIQSLDADGFLLERGPNSLRGTHELLELVDDLNLHTELVTADPKAPAYVYFRQALHPVPMSPPALLKTQLLSTKAKLRLLSEPFIGARRAMSEESLDSFVRRRLGDEIQERLVAPFVSGVYAGDPKQLSVQASFAKLAEFEAQSGSILKGAIKAARTARKNSDKPQRSLRPYRLCSFRHGLETLPQVMAKSLGKSVRTGATILKLAQISASKFQISFEQQRETETIEARSLLVATPASVAAQLLGDLAPELASLLTEIPYTKLCAVPLAYRTEQLARPLDGFGFLAPRDQGLRILGSIWNSSLFTNRAPEGWVMLNNFIGGETDQAAFDLSDDELLAIVHRDLQTVLGITGEPRRLPITRWQRAIPQYNLGHAARVAAIEAALSQQPGLWLVGNYLRGVAIGDCLKRGKELASEVIKWSA